MVCTKHLQRFAANDKKVTLPKLGKSMEHDILDSHSSQLERVTYSSDQVIK